ncbi:hypothetical protein AB6A40_006579 [Gnathostoma spinigerum]|uniref:NADH dehydrogenase [ubiquinone] 1 beta subcomplex subunit 1 n=1 Tax=Gnathostoma spinigerum TaxID=75299 RepID=A0ABD6EJZ0_9BILA
MGTFTLSYFFRTAVLDHKALWITAPIIFYIGRCWRADGYEKAKMMKGHSKMYADRIKAVPKGEDPWNY